ncbi:G2/mitotic-specific cyclin [Tulasnella sp. 424]|nr:G2/mitotic-specific cyclin [Tulasnella sp. 424]
MEESCGKVIDALLEVQEQIRASISSPSRTASPNLDWVSVDVGLQNSLEEHLRKLGELAGQIEFATGVLLQMNDAFKPTLDRTIEPRSQSSDCHTPLQQSSSPFVRRPRTISDLPPNLIATVVEFASQEDPSAVLKFSCVSRAFRHIALSNPRLWSHIELTALQPDALQLYLERSGNRGLDVILTSLTHVANDRDVAVWAPVLGTHSHRVVALTFRALGELSFTLANSTIRLCSLPSLRRVELQRVHGAGSSNLSKQLFRWDAFNPTLNSINANERLGEALSLLQQLETTDGGTENKSGPRSAVRTAHQRSPPDTTAELLAGSMQRLEVTSASWTACPDTDMEDNTPRKTVKAISGGTPRKLEQNQSRLGSSSPTIAISETSESTLLVIGEPTCLAEGSHDAMETEPTEASSARTMVDEVAKPSSDKDMCPGRLDDLDSEYENDPAMVSEYAEEIYDYLRKLEVTMMPDPHYMDRQSDLNWRSREILADWMLNVCSRFKLLPETYWLAMNLLDRFTSRRAVSLDKYQLAGSGCLSIASKFTEIYCPSIRNWAAVSDGAYKENDMRDSQRYILKILEYKISSPNPLDFLRRINRLDDYDLSLRTMAKYLSLIQCFQNNLLSITPSHLAASAYWLARISVGKFDWTEDLIRCSGYREDELIPHANVMVSYLLEKVKHDAFHRLWSTKKNLKVATFLRTWASNNWTRPQSGSEPAILPVDLSHDLPRLKEQPANEPCNSP